MILPDYLTQLMQLPDPTIQELELIRTLVARELERASTPLAPAPQIEPPTLQVYDTRVIAGQSREDEIAPRKPSKLNVRLPTHRVDPE